MLPALRIALLALCSVAGLTAADPAALQAPSHEALWLMKRVGAPVLSPDGRRAVFAVTEPAYAPKEQSSDLWLVATDGATAPRQLTHTRGPEAGVAFSADGHRIAFSAKRDGDAEEQIYVLDLDGGGEAQRVTSLALGARAPRFAPDGRSIAFEADVWPGARDDADNRRLAKERAERPYAVRVYASFPIRSWDHWLDERQVHLYVQSLGAGAAPRDLLAGSALLARPGYAGRSEDDGVTLEAQWTADGQGLVFTASTDRDQAAHAFTTTQLWYVPIAGGEPVALTAGSDAWTTPRLAADGRRLYAQRTTQAGHEYSNDHLVVMPFAAGHAGPATDLTGDVDRSVTSWGLATNERVWFLAEHAGREELYLAGPGEPAHLVDTPATGVYTSLTVSATRRPVLVARWESAVHPPEIVRIDPGRGFQPLTTFNRAAAARLDWQDVEHFWFKSRGGRDIHSLLVKPAAFDATRRYPLLVLMHGGPHTMWRDQFVLRWNYHLLARPGYVVLLTNYTGSTGFGEAFAQAIEHDPLAGPADEINQAADEAIARYRFIDGTRQCAAGASYGGHLANWLEASTSRYRCLVSHAGLVSLEAQWGTSDSVYYREVMVGSPPWAGAPLWREQSPIAHAERFQTPILLSVGERDFRVPLNNTLEFWTALQRQQVPSRLLVFPEANHWILRGEDSRYFYGEVAAWLARYLEPAPTTAATP